MMPKKPTRQPIPEVLLYADSESDSNMLYFGKVFVPDPFIAFSCSGKRIAVVSQLEFNRVRNESRFDQVLSLEETSRLAKQHSTKSFSNPASIIAYLGSVYKIKSFTVSDDFPCGPAFELKALGVKLNVAQGMLLPERAIKSEEEAECIRKGNAASSAGFRVVEKILRKAQVRKGFLYHQGRRLTSEFLQESIAVECLKLGAIAANTIVAGGDQACDPHCRGSGPLRANELIIVDIFPRLSATGYHGDMTRTYLKGRASEGQKKLYSTVFEAEQHAIKEHRSGKSATRIYQAVMDRFNKAGYSTRIDNGVPVGFIHGLGHGLGLAVHEPPRVNPSGPRLRAGQVITVEPGLYYPGLGGARVEDVVRVKRDQPELLSKHGYRWQIR